MAYQIASYLTSAGLRVVVRRRLHSGVATLAAAEPLSTGLARWARTQRARAQLVVALLVPWPQWTAEMWSRAHVFDRVLAVGKGALPSPVLAHWSEPRLTVVRVAGEIPSGERPNDPAVVRLACDLMIPLSAEVPNAAPGDPEPAMARSCGGPVHRASCTLPLFRQRVQT